VKAAALALLALYGSTAKAAEPIDKPIAQPSVTHLRSGDMAPMDGCFLPEGHCIAQARRIAGCEAERDSLRADVLSSPSPVLMVVIGILAGAAAGVAVTTVIHK
jgi:hypothetical protein